MADDALIAGAAAPSRKRYVTSVARLDALWVLAVSAGLGVSSLVDLIDLPNSHLRTGEAPLRAFVVAIPLVAAAVAVMAAWRQSVVLAASATGMLGPGIALAGSLSLALFLDEASAFADVGVSISLGAALLGAVMLIRWFVYHPLSLRNDEARPHRWASLGLSGLGAAVAVVVVVTGLGDDAVVAWVGATVAMLVVPVLLMAGGMVRTVPTIVLAASAAAAQVAAVLVVKLEQSEVSFDSDLVLRTGLVGLVGLSAAVVLAAVSIHAASPDVTPVDIVDDERWRWDADD